MQSPEDPSKQATEAETLTGTLPVDVHPEASSGEPGTAGTEPQDLPAAEADITVGEAGNGAEEPYDGEPEPIEPFTPPSKKQAFVAPSVRPLTKPITDKEPALQDCIAMLRETAEVVGEAMKQNAAVMSRMLETEGQLAAALSRRVDEIPDDQGNPHLRLLLGALANRVGADDRNTASLMRDEALWSQTVDVDGKHISGGIPKQRLANDGKYSLEELRSYVTRKAGVGGTVDFPLWHSGLWLRFRAPSLMALTSMHQAVADVKVKVGSESRGLAFSNVSHFIKTIVVDFALQHVIKANVSYATPTDLKPMIDTRDVPGLLLGLAATLYPGGYPYASPCVADLGACNHITKELYHLVNMWWVDTNALTQWQKRHMAFRIDARAPRTAEDLAAYMEQHTYGREELIRIGDLGFLVGSPDAYQHEELGATWLNGIIDMSQSVFNEPPEGRNRAAFIEQLAESTAAREYAHWVRAIVDIDEDSPEGYNVLSTDKEFIAETLSNVFSADELVQEFNTKIKAYIDRSLIAITAVISHNCPACHTPAATKFKERFENLIQVDPLAEFFMLASRKLNRILS